MSKLSKKVIITCLLALCFALCLCLLGACDTKPEPTDDAVAYTVTVKTDETTAASGVKVKVKKGSATFESKDTDANGKVEFSLSPDNYTVELSSLPEFYSVPDNATVALSKDSRDITIVLEKAFVYTVKLVDASGNPYVADGVTVGVCTLEGNCLEAVALRAGGVAIIPAAAGDYHVKVYDLPETALIECDDDGYYTGENFSATKTEMTIVVYPVTILNAGTAMTDAEKTEFKANNSSFNTKYSSYKATAEVPAGKAAYFAVKADITGVYYLYKDGELTFTTSSASGMFLEYNNLKAGDLFMIYVQNDGTAPATAQVVVSVPFSSYITHEGVGAELDVKVGKAATNAIIAFTPKEAGTYKMTVQGEAVTAVSVSNTAPDEEVVDADMPAESEFKKNASAAAVVHLDQVESLAPVYFAITAKAPVDFKIKIEKTAASQDSRVEAEVKETLAVYTKPQDKVLKGVPMNGETKLVLAGGVYHLGTAEGPVVVVKITSAVDTDRFSDGGRLAYLDLDVDARFAKYEIKSFNDDNTVLTIKNYAKFIRGFVGYEMNEQRQYVIPTNIETETYYAKFVNEDGVYPLTAELKTFLEDFYTANSESFYSSISLEAKTGYEWMFPCYYYDDENGGDVEKDAIVGEYKFVSSKANGETIKVGDESFGATITEDSYKLVVNENGTYKILEYDNFNGGYNERFPYEEGTWKKNGEVYTFNTMGADYTSATFNSATGALKLVDTVAEIEWEFVKPSATPAPEQDAIVGEYVQEGMMGNVDLSVKADGTYTIKEAMGSVSGTWKKNSDGTYTFTEINAVLGNYDYKVTRDATTGKVTFIDDNDPDFPLYEFEVKA